MTTFVKSAALTALLVPAAAIAGLDVGASVGTTDADIRAALTQMGYAVQEIEIEDDGIEAEVTLEGVAYEIEIAASTGQITEIALEDDEDDADD